MGWGSEVHTDNTGRGREGCAQITRDGVGVSTDNMGRGGGEVSTDNMGRGKVSTDNTGWGKVSTDNTGRGTDGEHR